MPDDAASLCLSYPEIQEVSTIKRYLIVRLRDVCVEKEFWGGATIRKFRMVRSEGARQVSGRCCTGGSGEL